MSIWERINSVLGWDELVRGTRAGELALRIAAEADATIARLEAELAESKKDIAILNDQITGAKASAAAGWAIAKARLGDIAEAKHQIDDMKREAGLADEDAAKLRVDIAGVTAALAAVQHFPTGNPETDTIVDRIKAADELLGKLIDDADSCPLLPAHDKD